MNVDYTQNMVTYWEVRDVVDRVLATCESEAAAQAAFSEVIRRASGRPGALYLYIAKVERES